MKIKLSKSQWEEMGRKAGWVEKDPAGDAISPDQVDYELWIGEHLISVVREKKDATESQIKRKALQTDSAMGERNVPYINAADVYWRPNGFGNQKVLYTPKRVIPRPVKDNRPVKSREVERIKSETATLFDTLPTNPTPEEMAAFTTTLNRLVMDMYKAKGIDPHIGEI